MLSTLYNNIQVIKSSLKRRNSVKFNCQVYIKYLSFSRNECFLKGSKYYIFQKTQKNIKLVSVQAYYSLNSTSNILIDNSFKFVTTLLCDDNSNDQTNSKSYKLKVKRFIIRQVTSISKEEYVYKDVGYFDLSISDIINREINFETVRVRVLGFEEDVILDGYVELSVIYKTCDNYLLSNVPATSTDRLNVSTNRISTSPGDFINKNDNNRNECNFINAESNSEINSSHSYEDTNNSDLIEHINSVSSDYDTPKKEIRNENSESFRTIYRTLSLSPTSHKSNESKAPSIIVNNNRSQFYIPPLIDKNKIETEDNFFSDYDSNKSLFVKECYSTVGRPIKHCDLSPYFSLYRKQVQKKRVDDYKSLFRVLSSPDISNNSINYHETPTYSKSLPKENMKLDDTFEQVDFTSDWSSNDESNYEIKDYHNYQLNDTNSDFDIKKSFENLFDSDKNSDISNIEFYDLSENLCDYFRNNEVSRNERDVDYFDYDDNFHSDIQIDSENEEKMGIINIKKIAIIDKMLS